MDLIKHTAEWASGDALQGKIMLGLGVLMLVLAFLILRSDHQMLRGMLIPIGLISAIGLAYGGFLTFSRPTHVLKVTELYQKDAKAAVTQELAKAENDHKTYSALLKVWPVLIAISALLLLFITKEYYRGLLLGLVGLFFIGLLLDTFLHHRLQPYYDVLKQFST